VSRSAVAALVCFVAIVGAVVSIVVTQSSRSSGRQARYDAGWRMCHECGHEWHMELGEIAAEARRDPTDHGYVQCPKCHAWRGMVRALCPRCGKAYPADVEVETEHGNVFAKRDRCPHCGFVYGSDVSGGANGGEDAPE
jgi:ssDNA-binding Zn-finger/Zn-ribbon topoisomerase 1